MNTLRFAIKITALILLCVLVISTSYSQSCFGGLYTGEDCVLYPGLTVIEDNDNEIPLYMQYDEFSLPQGPYNVHVNGIYFENEYFFSYDGICCNFGNVSDFGFDMDLPGIYTFTVQSIESLTNECTDNFNSPISVTNITVLPKPDFDIRFTCLPSGDVQLDVVIMSNFNYYGYLYVDIQGVSNAPQEQYITSAIGDTIMSGIVSLDQGVEYNIELMDCNVGTLLQREIYTHDCNSCVDSTMPSAVCKDMTIDISSNVAQISPLDLDNGSTDDCGVISYGINFDEFDCSHIGQKQVALTVSDAANNFASCLSTITITDSNNTCSQCHSLPLPNIEFSHTEDIGAYTRIWLRITNMTDYDSILDRLKNLYVNYLIESGGFSGSPFTIFANSSIANSSTVLSEYIFLDINFENSFRSCPVNDIHVEFHDDLCDISYRSNRINLTCDNDNDGFLISDDCNDNNALQYPGALEFCDGVDNNCDGVIDETSVEICDGIDNDCDGFIDEGFNDLFGLCCPLFMDITQSNIISGTYNASNTITSIGIVNQDSVVNLKAGSSVELLPGFEVVKDAVMHAFIAPCQ